MGDRITTIHPCPRCEQTMETYDASSSLLYVSSCDSCGYRDPREFRNKVDKLEEELLD